MRLWVLYYGFANFILIPETHSSEYSKFWKWRNIKLGLIALNEKASIGVYLKLGNDSWKSDSDSILVMDSKWKWSVNLDKFYRNLLSDFLLSL